MVGEVGFYLGMPSTASVITDQPTTYFRLMRDAWHEMRCRDPAIASGLDASVMCLLAERLVNISRTVKALLQ